MGQRNGQAELQEYDPITFGVITDALQAAVGEPEVALVRSASSGNLKTGLDPATSISERDTRAAVVHARSQPGHPGPLVSPVTTAIKGFGGSGSHPGDGWEGGEPERADAPPRGGDQGVGLGDEGRGDSRCGH